MGAVIPFELAAVRMAVVVVVVQVVRLLPAAWLFWADYQWASQAQPAAPLVVVCRAQ